jgi:Ca2+-binding RTX toxin-like protein
VVVVGSALNDFIALQGGGNKAVDGGLGNDVIDGGVGSTFISGGGGSNTFFLDGRAAGASWSTITDFKLGSDKATIWGWKAGVSKVAVVDGAGGAQGYQGLTLHFENLLPDGSGAGVTNSNLNSITLSNKTLSDFGASSLEQLNQQIASQTNSHFLVGIAQDVYGDHGYVFIS